ncbi:hypothetical protein [Aestuariivita boseongensis]|uniref:hypothetical protein n=1 Tax=Aestuariivita boseongensis TaxID=1470562 RepID=UPI0006834190|nr:hypothetical protein [Aestuariivita boseongensis]
MRKRRLTTLLILAAIMAAALYVFRPALDAQTQELLDKAHATPLSPPLEPLRVFHLGHSLVGRDMPAMLEQLAGAGHSHASQLGWGTSLRQHWYPEVPINGFDQENDHPRFLPAREAIRSGDFDAVILTEMVELRDAIAHHDSPKYKSNWADLAREASLTTRVYLYETWHRLDDPDGWLTRLDRDFETLWQGKILAGDIRQSGTDRATRIIPAGQVMAAFTRRVEAQGGVGNVADRTALFARDANGALDMIHLSDLGKYLVALTHYAVLYKRSPIGLPAQLNRADGSPATAPTPDAARLMQEVVWHVIQNLPETGVGT